ncbi:MAG TPA: thioredoxin-disulfide reductase [Candidatus Baltobacteraceae bacterium]|nr:thioredoxin-disulfide reductase [Candidatus Baltobacteraceae bacterium]
MFDVIILGSGPAGLTAGLYAARARLNPLIVDGHEPGGQLTLTTTVENFPGFPDGLLGPDLIAGMRKQAERFGAEVRKGAASAVDLGRWPFHITIEGTVEQCRALIIATGASARMLGLDSERKLLGHGVSSCATCDGFFFQDQDVLVVGGGDSAIEEALFLTRFAKRVTIVHRRETLRASKIMQEKAIANPKIGFLWDSTIEEVFDVSQKKVTGVRLRNLRTEQVTERPTDGVFLGIGHEPNTQLFRGILDTDAQGYLKTHDGTKTSIPGVFAAGDVQDHVYRQAITAAGSGCMAAIDAERFLEHAGAGHD